MKLNRNRPTERGGVNAAQSLFESAGWVFQEVHGENDYGKDAYVDIPEDGEIRGACIGVQIKSGPSYRRATDYAIPTGEHAELWRNSPMPIAGIVFDTESRTMYWCDLSQACRSRSLHDTSPVTVSTDRVLNPSTLRTAFREHFVAASGAVAREPAALNLVSRDVDQQLVAVTDCLALGRHDPRFLVVLRFVLTRLSAPALTRAIGVLSLMTPHPDVFWTKSTWLPDSVRGEVRQHFRWTPSEILDLFSAVDVESWHRGGTGQSLYMLLIEDPEVCEKLRGVALDATRLGRDDVAWMSLYVHLCLIAEDPLKALRRLLHEEPRLQHLTMMPELMSSLSDGHRPVLF